MPSPAQQDTCLGLESPQLRHSAAPGNLFSSSAVVFVQTLVTVCLVGTGRSLLVEELFCLCFQVSLPGKAVFQHLFSLRNGALSQPRSSESLFWAAPEHSAELDAEMFLCSAPRDLPDSAGMMNSDSSQSSSINRQDNCKCLLNSVLPLQFQRGGF